MNEKAYRVTVVLFFSFVLFSSQAAAVESFGLNSVNVENNLKQRVQTASSNTENVINSVIRYFFGSEEEVDRTNQGLSSFVTADYDNYRFKYKSSYSFSKEGITKNVYLLKHTGNSTQVLNMEEGGGKGCKYLKWDNGAPPGKWSDSGSYEFYSKHRQSIIGFKFSGFDKKEKISTSCTLNFSVKGSNSSFQHKFTFTMGNVAVAETVEETTKDVLGLKGVDLYNAERVCPMGVNESGDLVRSGKCDTFPVPTLQGVLVLMLFGFVLWLLKRLVEIVGKVI